MVPTVSSVVSPTPVLFVGTPSLRGDIARYAKRFNLLEVSAEPGRHPKHAGLLGMRRAVPSDFTFSVTPASELVALESGAQADRLIEAAKSVADPLGAAWWVLRTPPSVTPSARSLRALEALIAKLAAPGRSVAWEPRGIWRDEEAARAADSLGVSLVRDLLRDDLVSETPVVYTRIRALGEGARVGAAAAERIAERLAGADRAYVVIEGAGAAGAQKVLREAFGLAQESEDVSDDDHAGDDEDGDDEAPDGGGEDEEEESSE